ncbi:MAG: hypothetical protein JST29_05540 [Bacteroidetes bacterium]|nr:hypothetical protein [Bacteroidota bacterium]
MSLSSFLRKIFNAIAGLFNEAVHEVRDIALPVAINVVNILKNIVDFDSPDLLGSIAGKIGIQVEEIVRRELPKILIELKLVGSVANAGDTNQIIKAALKELQLSSDAAKNAFYHSISAMLATALSDGKLTWSEAVVLVEYYFKNKPQPENAQ